MVKLENSFTGEIHRIPEAEFAKYFIRNNSIIEGSVTGQVVIHRTNHGVFVNSSIGRGLKKNLECNNYYFRFMPIPGCKMYYTIRNIWCNIGYMQSLICPEHPSRLQKDVYPNGNHFNSQFRDTENLYTRIVDGKTVWADNIQKLDFIGFSRSKLADIKTFLLRRRPSTRIAFIVQKVLGERTVKMNDGRQYLEFCLFINIKASKTSSTGFVSHWRNYQQNMQWIT